MLNHLVTLLLLLLFPLLASAQEVFFRAPFDFPLYLSGNFAELRSNHFHGGLDFKTQGVEGKPIHCPADGYVSRISVSPGGYGNALYITHDNGYTTVHGHLQKFLPEMAALVREHQYKYETFALDTTLTPERFPVKQGEVVGYAGNSGYSFGPHLHMEVRLTETNEPVDPLVFYKDRLKDTRPPRATRIKIYPQKGRGVVNGKAESPVYYFGNGNRVSQPITAWGEIGIGLSANDYMNGTHNSYGVRYVRLYVDDRLVSSSDVDRFSFDENRLINSWTDYAEQRTTGRWYMRASIAENNELRMLRADEQRGWVTIDEERDYHFRYELEDLYGNRSTYRFVVRGKRMEIPSRLPNYYYLMDASRDSRFYAQGFELWMPQGTLFDDVELDYDVMPSESDQADIYQLTTTRIPLRRAAEITLPTHKGESVDGSKLYVARVDGMRRTYCGGTYKYGRITANVTELGTYTVCADTIAPKITPIGSTSWRKQGRIVCRIADGETGIRDYRGTIDGRWVLFQYSSKNARLTCDLRAEGIGPGRHQVEIKVTDMRGNVRVVRYEL